MKIQQLASVRYSITRQGTETLQMVLKRFTVTQQEQLTLQ